MSFYNASDTVVSKESFYMMYCTMTAGRGYILQAGIARKVTEGMVCNAGTICMELEGLVCSVCMTCKAKEGKPCKGYKGKVDKVCRTRKACSVELVV